MNDNESAVKCAVPKRYRVPLDEQTLDAQNRLAIETAKVVAAEFDAMRYVEHKGPNGEYLGHHMTKDRLPEKGLLLVGPTGTGKSTILGGVVLDAQSRGVPAYWIHWDNLLNLLKKRDRDADDDAKMLRKVPCLVLDELGQYPGPDFLVGAVAAVIEDRYQAGLPFLVASNTQTDDELRAAIGAPALSRLLQVCHRIPVLGEDRRKPKARRAA